MLFKKQLKWIFQLIFCWDARQRQPLLFILFDCQSVNMLCSQILKCDGCILISLTQVLCLFIDLSNPTL